MAKISDEERGVALKALALAYGGFIGHRNSLTRRLFAHGPARVFVKEALNVQDVDPISRYVSSTSDRWEYLASRYVSQHRRDIAHVVDWLLVAASERHPWTQMVDDVGRPKKLMKCGSLERLVHEADKAMRLRQLSEDQIADMGLTSADERRERDLGVGYYLVRLLSPRALGAESRGMRNCIGHGAYDALVVGSRYSYFSVRDGGGKRHATIEVFASKVITQFEGPKNTAPSRHVIDLVDGVRAELGWLTDDELEAMAVEDNPDVGFELARHP